MLVGPAPTAMLHAFETVLICFKSALSVHPTMATRNTSGIKWLAVVYICLPLTSAGDTLKVEQEVE